ncbi:hypothetical protein [Streptomyces sp. NPDC048659]|uniref:hypothetical protein n=1 Tax=Streptomyces sp. NPDC048659 TaxID=3155489 RepID=UPI00342FDF15
MANTRKWDQAIRTAEAKLKGVQARESWALPVRDQGALARHMGAVVVKATKLKSSARAEAAVETIWTTAAQRLQADIRAAEAEKAAALQAEATAKAERKAKGWW